MGNITENLKKILAAVYGRDVRQAIHDSIADCHDDIVECKNYTDDHVAESKNYTDDHVAAVEAKMSGITGQCEALLVKARKDIRKIQEIFSVEKTVGVIEGSLWEIQEDNICSLVEGVRTQYTAIDVKSGEWYIVHTCMVSRSSSGRGVYPIIFADGGDAGFTSVSTVSIEEEGDCDYIVTVPDTAKYMLVSANETGEGIRIRKINVLREGDIVPGTDTPAVKELVQNNIAEDIAVKYIPVMHGGGVTEPVGSISLQKLKIQGVTEKLEVTK